MNLIAIAGSTGATAQQNIFSNISGAQQCHHIKEQQSIDKKIDLGLLFIGTFFQKLYIINYI